jgi:hypothetical protein
MQSYPELISLLDYHHKERIRIRKLLIKFIRHNKHRRCIKLDGWVLRKMRLNYMGDLSDGDISHRCERILEECRT